MTPSAEHLYCNRFPGPLICGKLLNHTGGKLRAELVPAGQVGCMKLGSSSVLLSRQNNLTIHLRFSTG